MRLTELLQHQPVPLAQIAGAVVRQGQPNLLLFGQPSAAHSNDLVTFGFDDPHLADACGLGPLDSAVASEDPAVFVDHDATGGPEPLQRLLNQGG